MQSAQPAFPVKSVQPASPSHPLEPMKTVYPFFQPARPGQSMQAKASTQPMQVHATGETMGGLPWVVMKFGGTSVSTPERWQVIIDQMKKIRAAGERPFVAISALGSVTNRLIRSIDDALE